MIRPIVIALALCTLVGLVGPSFATGASLWDDFNERDRKLIPAKWLGDQTTDPGVIGIEITRAISGAKLLMAHRAAGDTGAGASSNRIIFRNPGVFSSIQYDVKVNSVSTTDCPGPTFTTASIQQFNFLFNTSDAPGCPTATCDVYAIFYLDHNNAANAANETSLHGRVVARDTSGGGEILLGPLAEFGKVRKGVTMTLTMTWDQPNHKVTFQKARGATIPVDYGVLGDNHVGGPLNTIEVDQFICGPGAVGDASSSWDKILVNQIP